MIEVYSPHCICTEGYPESLFFIEQSNSRNLSPITYIPIDSLEYSYNFTGEDILGQFDNNPMVPLYVIMGHMSRAAQLHSFLLNGGGFTPMVSGFTKPRFAYRKPGIGDRIELKSEYLETDELNSDIFRVTMKGDKISSKLTLSIQGVRV